MGISFFSYYLSYVNLVIFHIFIKKLLFFFQGYCCRIQQILLYLFVCMYSVVEIWNETKYKASQNVKYIIQERCIFYIGYSREMPIIYDSVIFISREFNSKMYKKISYLIHHNYLFAHYVTVLSHY